MDEKKNTILQNSAAEAEGPRIPLVNQDIFENDALLINRFSTSVRPSQAVC